jgi:hypothetical protein
MGGANRDTYSHLIRCVLSLAQNYDVRMSCSMARRERAIFNQGRSSTTAIELQRYSSTS